MANLDDFLTAIGGKKKDDQQRYRDYVIDAQSRGETPLPFKEWYELQQKK